MWKSLRSRLQYQLGWRSNKSQSHGGLSAGGENLRTVLTADPWARVLTPVKVVISQLLMTDSICMRVGGVEVA